MTAEELIGGLRERGYTIHRSCEPAWVIVPRLEPDDPICEFLSTKGALLRQWQTERYSHPDRYAYEASLVSMPVEVEPVLDEEGEPDKHATDALRRLRIWEAAAP